MSSREKFEQAIKARFGDSIDYRVCKNSDGEYMAWDMQVAWWAWQAAETDMAVQLANAESKCRELAAENAHAREKLGAAEKRIAELSGEFFALPPLNDDLIAILGRPNFTCAHLAELLRKGGQDIRRKSEFEQAAVIYWFLDLYLKYGDKWESIAKDDIQSRVAAAGIGVKGE
ncbi:hypothetical protein IHX80_002531 [Salmonella enterica]|nr:hypothetical protein [Salmonella enterica]